MAVRLEDEDERIRNLAKLFFNELSKKGKITATKFKNLKSLSIFNIYCILSKDYFEKF